MTTTELPVTITLDPYFAGIFVLQRDFQARVLDALPHELSPRERMEYIREQALALTDELHEALGETGWKSWASSMHLNREAYKGELADVFIFLMNLMLVAEISPAELLTSVKAKITKNHKRQDNGYDGVTTKCPRCKRAYDDSAVSCHPASELHGWATPYCGYAG